MTHRTKTRKRTALAAAVLPLLLAGCYEAPSVTMHSPGAYQGKADSAAIMHPSDEQRSALVQRFRDIQTDR